MGFQIFTALWCEILRCLCCMNQGGFQINVDAPCSGNYDVVKSHDCVLNKAPNLGPDPGSEYSWLSWVWWWWLCFCWEIRPPTRAASIRIFSSSWTNSPSRVTRFGWISFWGSLKGPSRRCKCRNWSSLRWRC